jgi:hypothetical protein
MKPPAAFVALAGALVSAWFPIAASAAETRLTDDELADQRGGLRTPSGLEIGFAASLRTLIDGRLVLATRLTWTDQGVKTQQVADSGDVTASPGGFTATVPGQTGGATQVVQGFSAGQITNIVMNTASNRTIQQDTAITLVIPMLAGLQQQVAADRIAASLQSALGSALRNRSGP